MEMSNIHSSEIKSLRTEFYNKINTSHTSNYMVHVLTHLTSYLAWSSTTTKWNILTLKKIITIWKSKTIHGIHIY